MVNGFNATYLKRCSIETPINCVRWKKKRIWKCHAVEWEKNGNLTISPAFSIFRWDRLKIKTCVFILTVFLHQALESMKISLNFPFNAIANWKRIRGNIWSGCILCERHSLRHTSDCQHYMYISNDLDMAWIDEANLKSNSYLVLCLFPSCHIGTDQHMKIGPFSIAGGCCMLHLIFCILFCTEFYVADCSHFLERQASIIYYKWIEVERKQFIECELCPISSSIHWYDG